MAFIKLITILLFNIFALTACSGPTLKTTSDSVYKESLKKIYDSQSSEEKRMEIAKAILYVISSGSETNLGGDSSTAYDLYQALAIFGGVGQLMVLDGKNAAEIIKVGSEARKKWALENLQKTIANYKEQLASLEKKKADAATHAEKVEQTQNAASIANATLDTAKGIQNSVRMFIVKFDAVNSGSLPIYSYTVNLEIKDSEKPEAEPVLQGDRTIEFKTPLLPGTTQKMSRGFDHPFHINLLPYGQNRYYLASAELKNVRTDSHRHLGGATFSEHDEKRLVELREQIAATETELQAYK